jgi:hypothetical protein
MMWPDRGYAPFRSEKGGKAASAYQYSFAGPDIPAGRVGNGVQSHEDLFVTPPGIKEKLLSGYDMRGTNDKVHLVMAPKVR